MKIDTRTETVHNIEGEELEQLLKSEYGIKADFIGTGDIPGDDADGFIECTVDLSRKHWLDGCQKAIIAAQNGEKYSTGISLIESILTVEASKGNVPEGDYRVHFCWG